MTRGGKSAIYYRLTSGRVSGYVWRGYLTQGVNNTNPGVITGPTVTAVETAQNNTILSNFPGTLQDPTLMTVAHRLATKDTEGYDASKAAENSILTSLTSDQRSKLKIINISSWDINLVNQLKSGTISYATYISKYLHNSNVNPSSYAGWKIGVGSIPKNDNSYWMSGYPDATIVLLPND